MLDVILKNLNPIQVLIFFTFGLVMLLLNRKNKIHNFVLWITFVCTLSEISNSILTHFKIQIGTSLNVFVIIHTILWLVLLFRKSHFSPRLENIIISIFVALSILNLLFGEGTNRFDYQTFVVGSLLYVSLFLVASFKQLQKEDLSFFQSNDYLLLCAPILFFVGLSFMFGFKSKVLNETVLFGKINLFNFIIYFSNVVYYGLINFYIYKEKKIQND